MDEIDQIFQALRSVVGPPGPDTRRILVAVDVAELRTKQTLLRHSVVNEPLVKTRRSRGDA